MTTRFKGKPQAASIEDLDAIPLTADADNKDYWGTVVQFAAKVKAAIGDATDTVSGLMPFLDKKKLDKLPDTSAALKQLTTDGGGIWVWIDLADAGDMLKAVYATLEAGKVDIAVTADKISGAPGNDKVYISGPAGVQAFIDQSALTAGLASALELLTGNNKAWVTNGAGTQLEVDISSLSVLNSEQIAGNKVGTWSGSTPGNVSTEMFIKGVASDRFSVAAGEAYEFFIRSFHMQDDFSDYRIQTKRGIIANIAGTTQLLGAIKVVDAASEIDTTANAVISTIVADDANDSLKISATGVTAETWNHKFLATFNKITP